MAEHPYQLLPPLSADEYAALRADIAEHGIRVPVDVDEHATVLDGHHRAAIAAELGIDYPTRTVGGLTEDEKATHALTVNLARRQLTREQRRDLVRREVQRTPDNSDRAIGRRCGCDHKTVASVRRELSGEIPQPRPLTAAQAKWVDVVFGIMRARTVDYCRRVRLNRQAGTTERSGEFDIAGAAWGGTFILSTAEECDDMDVYREASRRWVEWVDSAEVTRGVMWCYPDDVDGGAST